MATSLREPLGKKLPNSESRVLVAKALVGLGVYGKKRGGSEDVAWHGLLRDAKDPNFKTS